jgi:hypothetical protein
MFYMCSDSESRRDVTHLNQLEHVLFVFQIDVSALWHIVEKAFLRNLEPTRF